MRGPGQPAGVSRGQAVKGSNRNAIARSRLDALRRLALDSFPARRHAAGTVRHGPPADLPEREYRARRQPPHGRHGPPDPAARPPIFPTGNVGPFDLAPLVGRFRPILLASRSTWPRSLAASARSCPPTARPGQSGLTPTYANFVLTYPKMVQTTPQLCEVSPQLCEVGSVGRASARQRVERINALGLAAERQRIPESRRWSIRESPPGSPAGSSPAGSPAESPFYQLQRRLEPPDLPNLPIEVDFPTVTSQTTRATVRN